MDEANLLKAYATEHSDAAFSALVDQHIDVVYSAALRQVHGDSHAAEDVTQTVFIDLARRARHLIRHPSLIGWLYTSTRYAALAFLRTEQRRLAREHYSHVMNATLAGGNEPDFSDLRPILDELMIELNESDRTALLLRFFEKRPLAEVGKRFEISENAARMRVERALENLRQALERRGIRSTATLLGALVTQHAVSAAPVHLKESILGAMSSASPAPVGALAAAWIFMKSKTGLAIVTGVAVLMVLLFVDSFRSRAREHRSKAPVLVTTAVDDASRPRLGTGGESTSDPAMLGLSSLATTPSNRIRIICVAADVGKPVPNVEIDSRMYANKVNGRTTNVALRSGICDIFYASNVALIELTTRSDGFADTRLLWRPDHGERIPTEYTVRLDRSVRIGGRVVDADEMPVADAQVGFNHKQDPLLMSGTESHAFGWRTAQTDADGRWHLDCIAPELLRQIYGCATHSNHANSPFAFAYSDPTVEKQLRDGTIVFRLGRAVAVRGIVMDTEGMPVEGAKILVGHVGEGGRRTGKTAQDGTFLISAVPLGKKPLTAEADGFAPSTQEIEIAPDQNHEIILQRGKPLRVRVVDTAGTPVPKASVSFDPFSSRRLAQKTAGVQVEFSRRTDGAGRLVWTNAPDCDLPFRITAAEFMDHPVVVMRPREEEYIVELSPALSIFGTVRDAETGAPIPSFKVIAGTLSPRSRGMSPQWSTIDRFWMTFAGGQFTNSFHEPVIQGGDYLFVFKFDADGYVPAITRAIEKSETQVRFDILLSRGTNLILTVIGTDGRPAAGADVGLISMGGRVQLAPGGLSHENPQSGGSMLISDPRGQVRLPVDPAISAIVVANASGYGLVRRAELDDAPVMHLQPWGRIEGRLTKNGEPMANEIIVFEIGDGWHTTELSAGSVFRVTTDAAGKFTFEKVPPGNHRLSRLWSQNLPDGRKASSHVSLQKVTIESGQTTQVDVPVEIPVASKR